MSVRCPCVYAAAACRLTCTAVRRTLSSLLLAGSRTLARIASPITMRMVSDTVRCGQLARSWFDGHHTIRLIVYEQTRGIGDDERDNGVESGELGVLISGHVQYTTLSPDWSYHRGIRADESDIMNMGGGRARASEKEDAALEMEEGNNPLTSLLCIFKNGSRTR